MTNWIKIQNQSTTDLKKMFDMLSTIDLIELKKTAINYTDFLLMEF